MPAPKHLLAIVIGIALIADVALFVGVGYGVGALGVASQPATGSDYQPGYYNVSSGTLSFEVQFANVATGSPLITSQQTGQESTDLVFQTSLNSGSNCGGGNQPTWVPSDPKTPASYTINFSPVPAGGINFDLDGNPATTTTGSYTIPETSGAVAWCVLNVDAVGKSFGNQVYTPTGAFWQHTLILLGSYATTKVSISLNVQGQFCGGSIGGQVTDDCYYVSHSEPGCTCAYLIDNGGWSGAATTSAVYQSAGASFSFVGQPYVNGGTLEVSVNTGYDDGYYNLSVLCPQPRACGGSNDPEFAPNPAHVPDFQKGYLVKWSIPATANQNNSNPQWNVWTVELTTGFVVQVVAQTTIINPAYAPTTPVIIVSNPGGNLYPAIGDTVTLEIYANASATSGRISAVELEVYYLGVGQQAPGGCGSEWITSNCPEAQTLSVSNTGNNAYATFQFTVNPPAGYTAAFGWSAIGVSVSGQPSLPAVSSLSIRPSNCAPGQPCDPLTSAIGLWQVLGPSTLIVAILLAYLLVLVLLPKAVPKWALTILWVGFFIALIALILLFGAIQSYFLLGGPLGG